MMAIDLREAVGIDWPWFTAEDGDKPNLPTPEGAELGVELARLTETCPEVPGTERCHDCAFLAGTNANQCGGTLLDALQCSFAGIPFYCHVNEGRVCGGYARWRAGAVQSQQTAGSSAAVGEREGAGWRAGGWDGRRGTVIHCTCRRDWTPRAAP